ncbi:hypothetical protein E6H36_02710 [Candidatus Bathyarchaeota archaeon]|nr:MAG: hypothetical protein AUJ07_00135 [Crenarchaeota archaeon 13_1_40CM_3_53_5]TMI27551.1 MAG: hypothetical protein E6H36_02710 [Candidatus Bathyarchaeota archaeon]TMI30993.1 MAG: hypothetical protein E6H29_06190 [Candidatus Bathyarchaeota archaeon]
MVRVFAEAEVNDTEDPEKVAKALMNLFNGEQSRNQSSSPKPSIAVSGKGLPALETIKMILQRDQIRSAAGAVLRRGVSNGTITAYLNKQVAFAGHVSFCEPEGESPLGPIRLTIEARDPARLIEWLTGGVRERKTR